MGRVNRTTCEISTDELLSEIKAIMPTLDPENASEYAEAQRKLAHEFSPVDIINECWQRLSLVSRRNKVRRDGLKEIEKVIDNGPMGHYSPGTELSDDEKQVLEIGTLCQMIRNQVDRIE